MNRFAKLGAAGALIALGATAFALPVPGAGDADPVSTATDTAMPLPGLAAPDTVTPETTAPEADPEVEGESIVEREPAVDTAAAVPVTVLETFTGSASFYSDRFEGRRTASGVRFRQAEYWAAHRTLPFGTRLRVTNLSNGNVVEVEIVDRGPFVRGRVLDLSKAAARELDFKRAGLTRVRAEVLSRP